MSNELFKELHDTKQNVKDALDDARKWGISLANAEKGYRIAQAQKIATERANGIPVTIISDLVKGDEEVAKLRFDRDVAEVMYKTAMESINVYKKEIDIIKDEIKREWGKSD